MNTEQQDREPADDKLSAIYRSVSTERVPARLDEEVLGEASRALHSTYAPPIRWSRPLAWAAVIAVTFAILLQISELPTPESGEISLPKAAEREDDAIDVAEPVPPANVRTRSDSTTEPTPNAPPRPESVPPATPSAAGEEAPPRQAESADATDASERSSFTIQSTNLLDRAAENASEQLPDAARQPSPQAAGLAREFEKRQTAGECSTVEQAEPESWYACIERLRDAGRDTEAQAQLTALREAFPKFETPR